MSLYMLAVHTPAQRPAAPPPSEEQMTAWMERIGQLETRMKQQGA